MRRAALAGVLAMEPSVLVLDEPTAGLDGEGRAELYRALQRLREERQVTILLVSHDMGEVAALADHILALHQGRLALEGSPCDLFKQAHVLAEWGLDVPPLSQMAALLRKQGFAIPEEALLLDEVAQAILANLPASRQTSGAQRHVE